VLKTGAAALNFGEFLGEVERSRDYRGQIVHIEVIPARAASCAHLAQPLPDALVGYLSKQGIEQLYTHQAEAIDLVRARRDVTVVTSTASGKTLCYNLPVAELLLSSPDARALYVFPTKALAQDQFKVLGELAGSGTELSETLRPGIYDGDTPQHQRRKIRQSANVILTNPDMLHTGILPHHSRWAGFLSGLRIVVIDEIHTYRGIFGSNVANVIRRLQRLAERYGSRPAFVLSSATIANPKEHAERLIAREVVVVDRDGSPRGMKHFVFWNPPTAGPGAILRRSSNIEAQELFQRLVERRVQTIAFTKARVVAELLYRYVVEALKKKQPQLAARIKPYRGGYLPEERRAIERELFSGKLLGVTSTNALELGIDIGSLDACIIVGFPGTIASTWQQAGRAGRTSDDALAVFVAYNDPIDQYLMRHPEYFFKRSPEEAVIDPVNPYILTSHLSCAAFELPLEDRDEAYFGPTTSAITEILEGHGSLKEIDGRRYWSTTESPSTHANLRTISEDTYTIMDATAGRGRVLGTVDSISAPELVYPEAVYLHEGETYLVRKLDLEARIATVERAEVDYYTQPVLSSGIRLKGERESKPFSGGRVGFSDVDVTWKTAAFKKIRFYTMENIGQATLDLPSQTLSTTALSFIPPEELMIEISDCGLNAIEGLVGIRNMMLVVLPVISMSDRRDLSGMVESSNTGRPTIFAYDRFRGGLGYAHRGYLEFQRLLSMCLEMVGDCTCDDGCPSCVGLANLRPPLHQDPDMQGGWAIPSKSAAHLMLKRLLQT
jgi:DEAD/DEAH box helicase domain-containing protein